MFAEDPPRATCLASLWRWVWSPQPSPSDAELLLRTGLWVVTKLRGDREAWGGRGGDGQRGVPPAHPKSGSWPGAFLGALGEEDDMSEPDDQLRRGECAVQLAVVTPGVSFLVIGILGALDKEQGGGSPPPPAGRAAGPRGHRFQTWAATVTEEDPCTEASPAPPPTQGSGPTGSLGDGGKCLHFSVRMHLLDSIF